MTGFSVRGTVDGAAAGLPLVLTENGKQIAETKTEDGGKYEMRAPPGKYEVSTGAGASECISKGKTSVEVKNAPVVVTPNFKISGYQLEVHTRTESMNPFVDAVMTLYATSSIDVSFLLFLNSRAAPTNQRRTRGVASVPDWLLAS